MLRFCDLEIATAAVANVVTLLLSLVLLLRLLSLSLSLSLLLSLLLFCRCYRFVAAVLVDVARTVNGAVLSMPKSVLPKLKLSRLFSVLSLFFLIGYRLETVFQNWKIK